MKVFAAEPITNPALGPELQAKTGLDFFRSFIPAAITFGFVAGAIIFFFVMLMGAIQWIISGGNKEGVETARAKITNAIIGLFILFLLFIITNVIENFFGVNILTIDIDPLKIR